MLPALSPSSVIRPVTLARSSNIPKLLASDTVNRYLQILADPVTCSCGILPGFTKVNRSKPLLEIRAVPEREVPLLSPTSYENDLRPMADLRYKRGHALGPLPSRRPAWAWQC